MTLTVQPPEELSDGSMSVIFRSWGFMYLPPGRPPEWIDMMLRRLANGIYESHRDILEDIELLTAMGHLFDLTKGST